MNICVDLAEEVGIHIGDGSMNYYSGIPTYTIACHRMDDRDFVKNHIAPLISRLYGIEPKLKEWSQGTYGFRIYPKEMVEFKHRVLRLPLGKKKEIRIPDVFLRNPDLYLACLRGIFSTDGCFYLEHKYGRLYPSLIFITTSRILAYQIKNLLEKEAMSVSISQKKVPSHWRHLYHITTRGLKNLEIWCKKIGFINTKHLTKLQLSNQKII